jgi:hypothetical protein
MQRTKLGRLLVCVVVAMLFVFVGAYGFAAEKKKHDATISFETGSVAAGIGFSWGGGTLNFKGKKYPLKVQGMSVGKVGITKASAIGTVYNLNRPEDINGTYAGVGAGATVGGGGGAVTLKNQNGVVLEVAAVNKGLSIAIGAGGVDISIKK